MRLLNRRHPVPDSIDEALSGRFTPAEIEAIDRAGTVVSLTAGNRILTEGDPGREAVVFLAGTADVIRGDEVVANVGPGDLVGERSIMLSELRNASVVATSDGRVAVFSRPEFKSMLEACPSLSAKTMTLIESRS